MNSSTCPNCKTRFLKNQEEQEVVYCHMCGQSRKDTSISIITLIREGINSIFNLESRFFHTVRDLYAPSKLTKAFIEGKRKYYVNPVRLFFILLIALISISMFFSNINNQALGANDFLSNVEKSALLSKFNKTIDSLGTSRDTTIVNQLKENLFKNTTPLEQDTLGKKLNFQFLFQKKALKEYGILTYDAIHMKRSELWEKYNIKGFTEQQLVSQYIKLSLDPAGGIKYLIKNSLWALLLTIIIMSFFMRILYVRSRRVTAEHVILMLNTHSLLFLLAILTLLAYKIGVQMEYSIFQKLPFMFMLIYPVLLYRTIKRYYGQGFFKTSIKLTILTTVYVSIFSISLLFVGLIMAFYFF